jgi:glycosyltransferase involved in cell wall biosynthesis
MLIRAFRDLQLHQDYHLVFIGQESLSSPQLDFVLNELPEEVKERIHWLENISPGHLLHFYNAARLFVFPSKAEGFGIPPLEAAALKTPVLCSGTTAMHDFEFFGEDLFDPLNEREFRNKLQARLTNPPIPDRLSAISRTIAERYSWKTAAEELFKAITVSFNA